MNTAPDLAMPTTIAATDPAKAAEAPRIRLLPHGFSIDHPDPELGEQLMANALGVADREAMDGILRQLVKASVSGESPDEVNLSFMISMVKSIKPRDAVEAMLVAQMVSVHVMAMRCAHHLANADDLAQHDSAARALGRLARTFPAQIEALNRYRSHGEPAITVQNVSVGDGGNAIVGNVTQHASVIVSDKNRRRPRRGRRRKPRAPGEGTARRRQAESTGMSDHARNTGPMLASPRCGAKTRSRRRVPLAGGARQKALPHARRRAGIRRAKGKPERAQARPVHQGCDRRAEADRGVNRRSAEAAKRDELNHSAFNLPERHAAETPPWSTPTDYQHKFVRRRLG